MSTKATRKTRSGRPTERMEGRWAVVANPIFPGMLFSLILLVFVIWVRRIGDFGVETDFYGTYAPGAERIVRGDFQLWRYGVTGPMYECVLALGLLARIPPFTFAKVLSAASMVGSQILWTRLASQHLGLRTGRWVPWLLLVSPAFVRFGYIASSDAFYCFLFSLTLFVLTRAERARGAFKSGLLALVAFLTRYQALVIPGFGFAWWVGRPKARSLLIAFAMAFPGILLVALAGLAASGVQLPKPDFLYNIHYEVSRTSIDWDDYQEHLSGRADPWNALLQRPAGILTTALRNVPAHLENDMLHGAGPFLTVSGALGIIALFLVRSRREVAMRFAGCWLMQFVLLLPTQASERYALTQIPLVAIVAAWGLDALAQKYAASVRRASVWLGVALAFGLALNIHGQAVYQKRQPRPLLETAAQVRSEVPAGAHLMARKPHLPYLLGATWVYFPDALDLRDLRARLQAEPAAFVYYGRNEYSLRPNFRFLTFPPYRPEGWSVVRASPDGVLYRVEKEFFSAPIPEDDRTLRQLENDTLGGDEMPIAQARRLAAFLAASGRCQQCLSEYERIRQFAPLSPEEERNVEACRDALRAKG